MFRGALGYKFVFKRAVVAGASLQIIGVGINTAFARISSRRLIAYQLCVVSFPSSFYHAHSIFFTPRRCLHPFALLPTVCPLPRRIHVCSRPCLTIQQIKSPSLSSATFHSPVSLRTTKVVVVGWNRAGLEILNLSMIAEHSTRSSSVNRAPKNRSLLCVFPRLRFMCRATTTTLIV
jgi:hypothetical protein